MKNILLAIMLMALPVAAFSQNRALNKFYREHKRGSEVQNVKLPGWLIRFGGKIAKKSVKAPEEKMALDLLKKFGSVRFMYTEDGEAIPAKSVTKLREDLLKNDFDDLIMVREGQMNFQLMVQEEGEVIKNIFMIYNDASEGEMVFISAKTNISYADLKELIKAAMKEKLQPLFDTEEDAPVVETIL